MKRAGVIGLGDMGSGLARNLIENGFETTGYDLSCSRMSALAEMGGVPAESVSEVGARSEAVFVMVLNGAQAKEVILGPQGLAAHMPTGGAVILTATVKPSEAKEIAAAIEGCAVDFIDSPVTGGFAGAQGGTLTLMAAAPDAVLDAAMPALRAVSGTIHRVGSGPGDGQTVKACLQALIGSIFSATYESAALAAKVGVAGETLCKVFSSSAAGCGIVNTALQNVVDRQFEGTGSHIRTMHKDLTIALDMAAERGVPLHTAAAAMQIFNAGRSKYPDGDNASCARVIEEIIGAELHR